MIVTFVSITIFVLMKKVKILLSCYFVFIVLFLVQKPIFLLYHWKQSVTEGFFAYLQTMGHGLSMDMSVAAYCTLIPSIILLISLMGGYRGIYAMILKLYFAVVSLLVSVIFISDLELYAHWGFRIDATIFTYVVQPKEAAASLPFYMVIVMVFAVLLWSFFQYGVLSRLVVKPLQKGAKSAKRAMEWGVMMVLFGLLFVAIRGGVTVSTMNVGRVYFSEKMFLNHAAINPCFNMLSSMTKSTGGEERYRFMEEQQARLIVAKMLHKPATSDSIPSLLNTSNPNIILILLEGFGAAVVEPLGGAPDVTPHLAQWAQEGVFFRNMYAGSFRTDRGLVCVLSGYPAQSTLSITKHPCKSQTLSSIPIILKKNGYHTSFLYGGDLNFAYMKSYLVTQGVVDLTQDVDFPIRERLSKWGVPDHITFDHLFDQIRSAQEPFCKIFLTLSSHEPFEVPFNKFEDPYLNSVAYTDSCLGAFLDKLKQLPQWENTLVVIIPDHDMKYPADIRYDAPERHDIFSLWLGGAVRQPLIVDKICSQIDMAATLLNQLGIDYSALPYSRDIMHPNMEEFAFYAFPNGFGIISTQGFVVYDCDSKRVSLWEGTNTDLLLTKGKAYLQCSYNDIVKNSLKQSP